MGSSQSKKNQFEEVYNQYVEKIYRFIYLKVNLQETAEDLCSEAFSRTWSAFQAENNEIKNLPGFLYQTARNLVIDYYRQRDRTKTVSLQDCHQISDPSSDLEGNIVLGSDIETVRAALVKLKEDYQDVIIWHYLDELSISEIAGLLDKPEGTVRVMLHRALKTLRNELS